MQIEALREAYPASREDAKGEGCKLFFTGEPCPKGHLSPRYTCNNRCRECTNESAARRKAENPEAFSQATAAATAKWRAKNPEKPRAWAEANRDKINAANKRYKDKNPEKVLGWLHARREADREPSRRAALAWQKRNMPKKVAMNRARQAAKLQATPPWLTAEQRAEMEACYVEAARLTEETGIAHHVDHIEPLRGKTSCGLHVPWNLQVLTWEDNLKKGNTLLAA